MNIQGYTEVHRGTQGCTWVQRYTYICIQRCTDVYSGTHKCKWGTEVHVQMYTEVHIQRYAKVHIQRYTYRSIQIYTEVHIHSNTEVHIQRYTEVLMHRYTEVHIQRYTNVHRGTHTEVHIPDDVQRASLVLSLMGHLNNLSFLLCPVQSDRTHQSVHHFRCHDIISERPSYVTLGLLY